MEHKNTTLLAQGRRSRGWSLQRRGKVFYVRFQDGRRDCRVSTGERSRVAAMRWAEVNMPQVERAPPKPKGPGYDWQLAQSLDTQRARNKGRSEVYIECDLERRHTLLAFFQGKVEISRSDLEAFRDANRREGRKDESTRRAIIVLRRAIGLLERHGRKVNIVPPTMNPDTRANVRDPNRRGAHIPEAQLRAWMQAMSPAARALATVELTTGLRWGEMRRLAPEQLEETSEYPGIAAFISLPEGTGKDKSGRTMALCHAAYDALHLLWARKRGLNYSPQTSWRKAALKVRLKAQGRAMGRVHERDMRHNFATCNGERWDDIAGLMRVMGHLRTTHDRYQSATPRRLVKFALHAAETYGLARDPHAAKAEGPEGCAKVPFGSVTLCFVGHFLRMRYIG